METRFQTKAVFAAEWIRSAIRHGQLAPGERIDMDALTVRLSMSPTPIREALRALEAEGLMVDAPHRGMRVADFSTDVAEELYLLRADLETLATRLSVPRLTGGDIEDLNRLESRRRDAMNRGDIVEASDLNHDWHMGLYRPAMTTPYLIEFISRLWNAFPWAASWRIPGFDKASLSDHKAILAAVGRVDAIEASRLMEGHILRSKDGVLKLLGEAPVDSSRWYRGTEAPKETENTTQTTGKVKVRSV